MSLDQVIRFLYAARSRRFDACILAGNPEREAAQRATLDRELEALGAAIDVLEAQERAERRAL